MLLSILAMIAGTSLFALGINLKFHFVKIISVDAGKLMVMTFKGKPARVLKEGGHIYVDHLPIIGKIHEPAMLMPYIPNKGIDVPESPEIRLSDNSRVQVDMSYTAEVTNPLRFFRKVSAEGGYVYDKDNPGNPFDVVKSEAEHVLIKYTMESLINLDNDEAFGRKDKGKKRREAFRDIRIRFSRYTRQTMGFRITMLNFENVRTTKVISEREEQFAAVKFREKIAKAERDVRIAETRNEADTMGIIIEEARRHGINPEEAYANYIRMRMVEKSHNTVVIGGNVSPTALAGAAAMSGVANRRTPDIQDEQDGQDGLDGQDGAGVAR